MTSRITGFSPDAQFTVAALACLVRWRGQHLLGSSSIEAVLPTIAPDINFAELEGIEEGTAASDGFLEAISPETTPERKAELEEQLLRYRKFDTEAMVEIVRFFSRDLTVR